MVDAGHDVSYDGLNARFLLRPLGSKRVLTFNRKRVDGSEYIFYCCNMTSIIGTVHQILLGTVTENMEMYTKRKVAGVDKAREMHARMGYPSVKQAIDFDIAARDFQIAAAIYGKDVASTKHQTCVAEGAVTMHHLGTESTHL
jgi:hypothetical protein